MNNSGYAEWAVVIFLFGLMCAYSFVFGKLAIQVLLRLRWRGRPSSYRKWGVENDLFRPNSMVRLTALGIGVIISTFFTFFLAFSSTILVTEETTSGIDRFQYTLFFAMYFSLIGFSVEAERVKRITDMTRKLDGLNEAFHQRFPVSELLSMYEGLRPAPPLFWEEYANLSDEQISLETNRSYRERAAPYGHTQSSKYNRIVIVVATLTLLLTAVLAAKELIVWG